MAPIADGSPDGRRGLEILRRVVFVGGILAATWLVAATGGPLWRVRDVRFEELQKSEAGRMAGSLAMMSRESGMSVDPELNTAATESLDAYVAGKITGRLIVEEGPEWQAFFDDVSATLSGKSPVFLGGLSDGTGTSYLYFPGDAIPLARLVPQLNNSNRFSYVTLQEPGRKRYLDVLHQSPGDAMRYAPSPLIYPGRKYAVWVFIASVLAYAFLPWPKFGPRTLSYSRGAAVVVPDLLGAALAAFFFVIPVLVIGSEFHGPLLAGLFDFELGWIWLTVVMWVLAAFGLGITATALWYSLACVTLLPQGLRWRTFFGSNECAYSEIERVDQAVFALPRWLKTVMFLAGFLNWRLAGALWIGATQENRGIKLRLKDGRSFKVWLDYMDGLVHVFRELKAAGVPMSPDLAKSVDEWMAEFPDDEPWPNASRRRSRLGLVLVALAVIVPLGLHFRPAPPRELIKENPALTPGVIAGRARLLKEMNEARIEMDAAMQRYKYGPAENRMKELDRFNELMNRFDELGKKHDALSR
jgi:hypothetical protein